MTDPVQAARPVIQKASLDGIRLGRLEAETSIRTAAEVPTEVAMTFEHTGRVALPLSNGTFLVEARGHFVVKGASPPGPDAKPAVRIDMTFVLEYSLPPEAQPTEQEVAAFAQVNGVFHAWPYWRELIQNTLARMGLPSIPLPVYRIRSATAEPPPLRAASSA